MFRVLNSELCNSECTSSWRQQRDVRVGEMDVGMGAGAIGRVLIGGRGLGCFLAGQEGRQKSGKRRWSRHTGEHLRLVRRLNVDRGGEELVVG